MRVIRTVFAGTPEFAVPSLRALHTRPDIKVVGVYTQPDRSVRRGGCLTGGPIKDLATKLGLTTQQPTDLRDRAAIDTFKSYKPEILVVAAYGQILPKDYLDIVAAPINVHASLLPRWRGAAPIQRALLAGDCETGISIIRLVDRLDAGPIWLAKQCPIQKEDTGGTMTDRLATLGAKALDEALDLYVRGAVEEHEQNESLSTYATKVSKSELIIDWSESASQIERRVRALSPAPGVHTELGGKRVKILLCEVSASSVAGTPGTIAPLTKNCLEVVTGDGVLAILELQPASKKPMSARAFINGYRSHL